MTEAIRSYLRMIGGRVVAPVIVLAMTTLPALAEEMAGHGAEVAAHGAAAAEAGHGSSGGLPQFNAEWFPSQLFWLAVTFCVLYVFFSRVPLPRIEQTMRNRQRKIQDDMSNAEILSKRAATIREAYEREMAKAREKASEAMKAMDDRVKEKMNDRLYSYRTKFTAEIARAEDDLARARDVLTADLNTIAAETAAHAASLILQAPADLQTAQQVVDHLRPHDKAA